MRFRLAIKSSSPLDEVSVSHKILEADLSAGRGTESVTSLRQKGLQRRCRLEERGQIQSQNLRRRRHMCAAFDAR